jgi:methyltransferase FkbM-like protein
VDVRSIALSDMDGAVDLLIDADDSGGTRIDTGAATTSSEVVSVPCRPLLAVLAEAAVTTIDALKIDVEGVEDLVLGPFLRDAPPDLLPALVLIEDTRGYWRTNVFTLLEQRGYTAFARSRHNVALRRA